MASNVYTKNEILQELSTKGFFVDNYTLDTFFAKWKIEAIFEDEQGCEFYDTNALDLVLNNLFSANNETTQEEPEAEPRLLNPQPQQVQTPPPAPPPIQPQVAPMPMPQPQVQMQPQYQAPMPPPMPQMQMYGPYYQPNTYEMQPQPMIQNIAPMQMNKSAIDPEANNLLKGISLSDGSSLMSKIQGDDLDSFMNYDLLEQEALGDIQPSGDFYGIGETKKEKKIGILEGAMLATGQEFDSDNSDASQNDANAGEAAETSEGADFDDISLLSESYEAQEKFREYVVSELSKKNVDLTPKNNEFKLDISERTLNMVARSVAKKIVKHVSQLYSGETKASEKLEEIEEKNKKLEIRARDLEDQNKKLRLLLAESNKNLNSYKPSLFGLYKKVPPAQK